MSMTMDARYSPLALSRTASRAMRRPRPRPGARVWVAAANGEGGRRALSLTVERDYGEALEKLAMLQSNRTTKQLFQSTRTAAQLNAQAMPEMQVWLRRAGYAPQDLARMRHIHVAGTKGKGSVCAYTTAVLRRCGVRAGSFTSPHLTSPRERIAIDGAPLDQQAFADAFFQLWDRFTDTARAEGASAAQAESPESKPAFFRFLTLMAWHVFLTSGLRDVVIECGIGGEFDATNLLPPEAVSAAVITALGVDHAAMLGDSIEQIAWHKAGIMKPGVRCFTRNLQNQPRVMQILRQRAKEKQAVLIELGDTSACRWQPGSADPSAIFSRHNQALAMLAACEHLGLGGKRLADSLEDIPYYVVEGLHMARLRGRFETVEQPDITWFLDGAHTTDSIAAVAHWLASSLEADEQAVLVFNQKERDVEPLLTALLRVAKQTAGRDQVFSHALFTRNDLRPRLGRDEEGEDMRVQAHAAALMAGHEAFCRTSTFGNVEDAVAQTRRLAGPRSEDGRKLKVLVTGSLHLVGGVLRVLEPDAPT